ncbi:MAG: O-antigen ligase family protein [Patescibacteria group bacterium]|nr:O-antigen ligase family protein [Patescibacteria group bacterium]
MYIYFLVLICAVLPAYQIRFQIFGLPMTLLEVMILILFVVWLIKYRSLKQTIQKLGNWKWIILIWLIISTLAMFIAPNLREAAGIWKAYFVEPILLLIVFVSLVREKKDLNLILNALIFSALYCSVWAICQKIFHFGGMMSTEVWNAPKIWRATGPFPQSNFLGLYLGPIIVLTFGQIIANRKKCLWFIAYSLIFVLSLAAIILARSNGAILGVLAGLIFIGLIHKSSRKWTTIALIILLLIIKLLPVARNYVWQEATFQNLSGQLRVNIWQGAISLIKTNPILGVGLDGYQNLIPQYQARFYDPITHQLISVETHPYPHNLFLALWCELGLAGLTIFLIIIFQFFKLGFRELFRNLKLEIRNLDLEKDNQILILALLASIVTILIHGLVDTPYFKNDLSILFWLIIGLTICLKFDIIKNN